MMNIFSLFFFTCGFSGLRQKKQILFKADFLYFRCKFKSVLKVNYFFGPVSF